jgi:hypothetical protein
MGGIGAVAEPLVVVALLIGGTWINRHTDPGRRRRPREVRRTTESTMNMTVPVDVEARSTSPSLLVSEEPRWRQRKVGLGSFSLTLTTPNSRRFKGYFLSRLLERFPFLVECWYWALIYWVCLPLMSSRVLPTGPV